MNVKNCCIYAEFRSQLCPPAIKLRILYKAKKVPVIYPKPFLKTEHQTVPVSPDFIKRIIASISFAYRSHFRW
jgi:hypothetical protein